MLIFLYGSDGYRLKQNTNKVADSYKKKYQSGLNFFEFDLSDNENTDNLEKAIKSASFFNELKLITVSNFFGHKTTASKVHELIGTWDIAKAKDIVLLAIENLNEQEIISKNKELFKILKRDGSPVKAFEPLEGSRLSDWIETELELRAKTVEPATVRKLIALAGNDSWTLANEIEKLANYATGAGRNRINEDDITRLISPKISLNIFNLVDAIAAKNKISSLELLYREMATDRDPQYILSMISYQFRNLMLLKSLSLKKLPLSSIISKSGLHPFVARKISSSSDKFSEETLKRIFERLVELDVDSKNGTINLPDSLFKFVLAVTA